MNGTVGGVYDGFRNKQSHSQYQQYHIIIGRTMARYHVSLAQKHADSTKMYGYPRKAFAQLNAIVQIHSCTGVRWGRNVCAALL